MRHRARGGNAIDLIGHGACSARAAADERGSRAGDGAHDALRAARAELKHGAALGCAADAARLCGDQALVVELEQHIGLQQLRLNSRGADGDDRLHREDGRALGDRPDIAREFEITQIVKEALAEDTARAQVGNVLLAEVQLLDIVDYLLQPRGDGVPAAVGDIAVENVKVADAVLHAVGKVAVAHSQLVEIAEHGQIDAVSAFHILPPRCKKVVKSSLEPYYIFCT